MLKNGLIVFVIVSIWFFSAGNLNAQNWQPGSGIEVSITPAPKAVAVGDEIEFSVSASDTDTTGGSFPEYASDPIDTNGIVTWTASDGSPRINIAKFSNGKLL